MSVTRKFTILASQLILLSGLLLTGNQSLANSSAAGSQVATAIVGVVFPEDDEDDAWVVEVREDGPAEKAGIKPGDTITRFNEQSIKTVKRFRELLSKQKPGDLVKLTVRHGKDSRIVTVKLVKREE